MCRSPRVVPSAGADSVVVALTTRDLRPGLDSGSHGLTRDLRPGLDFGLRGLGMEDQSGGVGMTKEENPA